jgi:hypothetical protein
MTVHVYEDSSGVTNETWSNYNRVSALYCSSSGSSRSSSSNVRAVVAN